MVSLPTWNGGRLALPRYDRLFSKQRSRFRWVRWIAIAAVLLVLINLAKVYMVMPRPPGLFDLWEDLDSNNDLPGTTGRGSDFTGPEPTNRLPGTSSPIPLCMVGVWEQGPLSPYVRASLDSFAAGAGDFAQLYLFLSPQTGLKGLEDLYGGPARWPRNVHAVDMGDVSPFWKHYGWDEFVVNHMCRLLDEDLESTDCNRLRKAIKSRSSAIGGNLVQLRALHGELFSPWLKPSRCESWAWVDLDTLWGNLPHHLDVPLLREQSDVYTLSYNDQNRFYTRGQFTAWNQRNMSVNTAWRECHQLQTMEDAYRTFNYDGWQALDEGCAAHGVMERQMVLTNVPFQEADWQQPIIVRSSQGKLVSCYSTHNTPNNRARCRTHIKQYLRDTATNKTPSPLLAPPVDRQKMELAHPQNHETSCSSWLPWYQTYCLDSVPWAEDKYIVTHGNAQKGEFLIYPKSGRIPIDDDLVIWESAVFHMQNWKKRKFVFEPPPPGFRDVDLEAGYYDIEIYRDGVAPKKTEDPDHQNYRMRYVPS
ncbi:hypothetical protein DFS34DRAFT_149610 [Phlyctochytrium arcticum]|nr:hypothetical protein DFS34DRAFT_149610 [Phlyctochytrium arcticum]